MVLEPRVDGRDSGLKLTPMFKTGYMPISVFASAPIEYPIPRGKIFVKKALPLYKKDI